MAEDAAERATNGFRMLDRSPVPAVGRRYDRRRGEERPFYLADKPPTPPTRMDYEN